MQAEKSIPTGERGGIGETAFRLFAEIHYRDGSCGEPVYADFCSAVTDWQYASLEIAKAQRKSADFIRVGCEYSHNLGTAYFDGLALSRTSFETGLTLDDFAGYDEDDEIVENTDDTELVSEDTEEDTAPEFEELTDTYGNALTETTYADGEFGTIYRAFGYTANGNDLIRETDARGNDTTYTANPNTSRNESVTDRLGNKTEYVYDDSGRTTKVTSVAAMRDENGDPIKDSEGNIQYEAEPAADVSYSYDTFDNMTEIVRGDGMKYVLSYNAYHNLESIGIDGKTDGALVRYDYKAGNGRLKSVTYANGDKMKATYNSIGQMIAEKWYDSTETLTAHYKYTYDAQGNIVRSIDITAQKEYNYMYENDTLVRSAEYDITVDNELVTAKTHVASTRYYYDAEGNLTKKRIIHADGSENIIYHETTDDNTVVKFDVPDIENTNKKRTITSRSSTDSFGRKIFDELQLGTGFVSRQFAYFAGDIPEEHKDNGKVKSASTTNLVSQIILSDGRTISYEYDAEERITKVTDSIDGTYDYTYDSLGQLLTETVTRDGVSTVVNSMTYTDEDHPGCYGNILTKNGVVYEYDTVWKDKLVKVGNDTISYDAQGNPLNYLGHTLTWEKGRQLKSFDTNTYTYNANGIRTSKIIDGIKHTYTLDGAKILREAWTASGINRYIIPFYDNEDSVCGINYCGTPFYFLKNLQGDVIAITNADGEVVARYTYDAWGVCTIASDTSGRNISIVNPFRYRGYYYDVEIGLYYLQSRYYDPVIGRFVNGDESEQIQREVVTTVSYGLYTYCNNSSIVLTDKCGFYPYSTIYSHSRFNALIMTNKDFEQESKYIARSFGFLVHTQVKTFMNKRDFLKIWNGIARNYDVVIVNSHSYPVKLEYSIAPDSTFARIKAKVLMLLGCNAGHAYYRWSNVAVKFSRYVSGYVVASDGTVSSLTNPHINPIFSSVADRTWKNYYPYFKRPRSNSGWVIYRYNKGLYYRWITGMYSVSANEMLSYLCEEGFVNLDWFTSRDKYRYYY